MKYILRNFSRFYITYKNISKNKEEKSGRFVLLSSICYAQDVKERRNNSRDFSYDRKDDPLRDDTKARTIN